MQRNTRCHVLKVGLALFAAVVGTSAGARADLISDPPGDFIATYPGPPVGDLDVLAAEVRYDGTNFTLRAIMNGPIGATAGGIYVLGFNRGAGTPGFAGIGHPGVIFDRVFVLPNNIVTAPPAGVTVTFNGNEISAVIPGSLSTMASTGFAPADYTWNLWPRNPIGFPGTSAITDFAPDNSMVKVTAVPAPASLVLLGLGAMTVSATRWTRRNRPAMA